LYEVFSKTEVRIYVFSANIWALEWMLDNKLRIFYTKSKNVLARQFRS